MQPAHEDLGTPIDPIAGPVWVVGAESVVGSALCRQLQQAGTWVFGTNGEVDIGDGDAVERFLMDCPAPPTHIFNCYELRSPSPFDLAGLEWVNVAGPYHLGRLARKFGYRVVHLSTAEVLGHAPARAVNEFTKPCPQSPYAHSKAEGERVLQAELSTSTILRTSQIFGGIGCFVYRILGAARQQATLSVVDDQRGRPTCASDLAAAMIVARDTPGLWHFANAGTASWHEVAHEAVRWLHTTGCEHACREILPVGCATLHNHTMHPYEIVLDTSRFERAFHMEPRAWKQALWQLLPDLWDA